MKLVEILARELKEWPEDAIRITQEVDGFTMIEYPTYIQAEGAYRVSEDRHAAFVTRAQWEAERARITVPHNESLPYAFTEADIKKAFTAGANWSRGGVEDGANDYVKTIKGL